MSILLIAFNFLRNSWIGRALAVAVGIGMAVLLVFSAGKRAQRRTHKIANLEGYINARQKADAAADAAREVGGTLSDDELAGRLRDHNAIRRE